MSPQPTCRPKSTGPRTAAGKRISSKNALQHGLASATILMPGEDAAAFHFLTQSLIDQFQPKNPTESILVTQMAKHHWLSERAMRLQAEVLSPGNRKPGEIPASLAVLHRYQIANQRGFQQCLNTLNSLRKQELAAKRQFVSQPVSPPAPELAEALELSPTLAMMARQCGFDPLSPPSPAGPTRYNS